MACMTWDYLPILLPTGCFPIQQTSRLWPLPLIFYNPGFSYCIIISFSLYKYKNNIFNMQIKLLGIGE